MKAQKKKDESDYTVKIVIIGDSGVGKTNILLRFCDNQFKTIYTSTIGVDFKIKILPINGYKIKLQIWDTAGQERFKNVNQTYYKGAISVILVYAVDNPESFDNVENWVKQIHEHSSPEIIKFLVANKCDLEQQRKVDTEMGKKLAFKYGMEFAEVSAKDGMGVASLFEELGRQVYEQIKESQKQGESSDIPITKRISLHKAEDQQPEKKSSCRC